MGVLARAVELNRGLESLCLRGNHLTCAAAISFRDALMVNTTLTELDLRGAHNFRVCHFTRPELESVLNSGIQLWPDDEQDKVAEMLEQLGGVRVRVRVKI